MINSIEAQDLLVNLLKNNMPVGLSFDRVKLPNLPFPKMPSVANSVNVQTAHIYCWLDFEMRDTVSESSEATGLLKRTFGNLTLTLNWPKNTGNREAKTMAESLRNLFANQWLVSLKLGQGTIISDDSGTWYENTIIFDYYYEGLT